jgi:hypothetical protein
VAKWFEKHRLGRELFFEHGRRQFFSRRHCSAGQGAPGPRDQDGSSTPLEKAGTAPCPRASAFHQAPLHLHLTVIFDV